MDNDTAEPPKKKIKPYVTKRERQRLKALQEAEANNDSGTDHHFDGGNSGAFDVKTLFVTSEELLHYDDNNASLKSSLPRRIHCQKSVAEKPVWSVQWCPKYSHLLAATCGDSIKLFDVLKESSELVEVYEQKLESQAKCLRWSRTSRQLLTTCFDGSVKLYDFLADGKEKQSLAVKQIPSCVSWWKGDDNTVIIGGENCSLSSYDLRSGKETIKYKLSYGNILSLDIYPNGLNFVTSCDEVNKQSAEHNLVVWDVRTGAKLSNQIFHERYTCPCVRVHPSGASILAQTTGNYIARFSAQSPYRLDKFVRFQNHTVNEHPVQFDVSKDGKYVLSGSSSGSLVAYRYSNGNYLQTLNFTRSLDLPDVSCVDVQCHPVIPSMVAVSDWDGVLRVLK